MTSLTAASNMADPPPGLKKTEIALGMALHKQLDSLPRPEPSTYSSQCSVSSSSWESSVRNDLSSGMAVAKS